MYLKIATFYHIHPYQITKVMTGNCFHYYVGIKESDTGLAAPAMWDLAADKQTLHSEQPLQVNHLHE